MEKISKIQLYCMMVVMTSPIAFLQAPKRLINLVDNNAWLPAFASIVPGILIVLLYIKLIEKSRQPFPLMLEEHLGKIAGKILGFIYIGIFILVSSYALRLFVDFMEIYVQPATPISVLTGLMLLGSFVSLRAGLTAMGRICEITVYIGLSFTLVILVTAIINYPDWGNLMPLGYMSFKNFGIATWSASTVWSRIIPVLTIAYFIEKKMDASRILFMAVATSVCVIGLTAIATLLTFGAPFSKLLVYPTFAFVRLIQIGEFVQHLDIIFVGIWVLGVYATLFITWFMSCFTAQQVFGLREYRFLAAPISLIIGVLSIIMSNNIIEFRVVTLLLINWVYFAAFIIIPFIVLFIALIKPAANSSPLNTGQESEFQL